MTFPNVYVVGGKARETKEPLQEWAWFDEARVLRVDPNSGETECVIRHVTPPELLPDDGASVVFKAGFRTDASLLLVSQTEVLEYDLDRYEIQSSISHPCFNDLHHVRPLPSGNLAVAVTGLDLIVEITRGGDIVREWPALDEDAFTRFARDKDYRKVATTKPHLAHPNYVFELSGQLWTTRFNQRDAICLENLDDRISISDVPAHDGHLLDGALYFTTVQGDVVVVDVGTYERTVHSLPAFAGSEDRLGWCRGLTLLDEGRRAIVGFTRLRKTKFERNVAWAKRHMRRGLLRRPDRTYVNEGTMILCVDLEAGRILGHVDLEPHGLNAIFSIHRAA
ncbi:MAG: hypothetical protein MJB57_15940 [Gemmatimonadetes bacterium]|nr:hypothetical protein [Gemmatimonadota bacterium]